MQTHYAFLNDGLHLGTVYGALLNDKASIQRLEPQFGSAPYKAAPKAPILYIKSRNTLAVEGTVVEIPAEPGQVRIDATVGLVMGRAAKQVSVAEAMDYVAGFVIVSDVTLPHDNYYRPAVVQRNRDGFCPMSNMVARAAGFDLDNASLQVEVNGHSVYERSFSTLVRSAAQLLADVSAFMTLSAGDVLLLGPGEGSPNARGGDQVKITVPGLGVLSHSVVEEQA